MNLIRSTTLALLACITATACGDRRETTMEHPVAPSEPAITEWPATRQTDLGNYSVTIKPAEGSIERNRHFSIEVSVASTEKSKTVGADLEIAVDADMPAHRHGMNTRPKMVKIDEARYRADGMLLHMGGDWVITVRIKGQSEAELASFPVSIE